MYERGTFKAFWSLLIKLNKEPLLEPFPYPFMKLIECYFETSYLFVKLLLPDPTLLHVQDKKTTPPDIPPDLQAEYSLLHLQDGASLDEVHAQYRQLAKLYHPDVGGQNVYFLALQQAYERVVEHLQYHR